ncbi:MAG: hypothetical protein NTU95_00550 [Methanothrix sp.]|nr:hypothetical protein [Methanothrix sp.]
MESSQRWPATCHSPIPLTRAGTDWYNQLAGKFDESAGKGEPMVVVFTNTVSGSGEYLDAYKKFVEYAVGKGASFVTTKELVESAKNA